MSMTSTPSAPAFPVERKGWSQISKKAYFTTPKIIMEVLLKSNEMDKKTFMQLLGGAYYFPDYYNHNLDSAEEIIEDIKEEKQIDKLPLKPLFDVLLAQEPEAEREKIWAFMAEHFRMED